MKKRYLTAIELIEQTVLEKSGAPLFPIYIKLVHKQTLLEIEHNDHIYANTEASAEELRIRIGHRIAEQQEDKLAQSSLGLFFKKPEGSKWYHSALVGNLFQDPAFRRGIRKGWAPQGIAPFTLLKLTCKDLLNKQKQQNIKVDEGQLVSNKKVAKRIRNAKMHIAVLSAIFTFCSFIALDEIVNWLFGEPWSLLTMGVGIIGGLAMCNQIFQILGAIKNMKKRLYER